MIRCSSVCLAHYERYQVEYCEKKLHQLISLIIIWDIKYIYIPHSPTSLSPCSRHLFTEHGSINELLTNVSTIRERNHSNHDFYVDSLALWMLKTARSATSLFGYIIGRSTQFRTQCIKKVLCFLTAFMNLSFFQVLCKETIRLRSLVTEVK